MLFYAFLLPRPADTTDPAIFLQDGRSVNYCDLPDLDGSGKSTAAKSLAKRLNAVLLRTPINEILPVRSVVDNAFTECPKARVLFYTANVHQASQKVQTLLQEGRNVVMDRYWLSTQVYAKLAGIKLPYIDLSKDLESPTFTFFLQVSHSIRRKRLEGRGALQEHDRSTLIQKNEKILR